VPNVGTRTPGVMSYSQMYSQKYEAVPRAHHATGKENGMGRLTTHVLDTAHGCPASGVSIELYREHDSRPLVTMATNSDGRTDRPLLEGDAFIPGIYELVFTVGAYFAATGAKVDEPPFLDRITIRVGLSADQHYHVPLLVSPWNYATYRGS